MRPTAFVDGGHDHCIRFMDLVLDRGIEPQLPLLDRVGMHRRCVDRAHVVVQSEVTQVHDDSQPSPNLHVCTNSAIPDVAHRV